MPNQYRDIQTVDATNHSYIFAQNVSIPLRTGGFLRCNVYKPRKSSEGSKYPVLVTYGPYGKDVPYEQFNPKSFAEVDPAHRTEHSAWETPTPQYWTDHGYVVVRVDEPGIGQSPGQLHVISAASIDGFCETIEWAACQPWSSGKVGLLGISYYAATQWQVAARQPKGLAAIVPWEGFSDAYNESLRHGGILSNKFFSMWYDRQVAPNQYGLPGRAARNWGPDTVDGDLSAEELDANRYKTVMHEQRHRDNKEISSLNFNLEDVTVPLLSVANLGGILLHLRGNVMGYLWSGSEFKYLRFIVGRHDLPFYYPEEVEIQRSFLDAWLKGHDREGWTEKGALPPVDLILRKGNAGYNNPTAEKQFLRRKEKEWPLARTQYTPIYLTADYELQLDQPHQPAPKKLSYSALGKAKASDMVTFQSAPFEKETEITGHIVAHLNVSVSRDQWGNSPSDLDLFLSLRHISPSGDEVSYTGSTGDPVPVTKGWLRVSLRKTDPQHPRHRPWLPYRNYYSTDVLPVIPGEVYPVDVELWPTNVVVEAGGRLVLEVSSGDTAGTGIWGHDDPIDRSEAVFKGLNNVHFGPNYVNYITLPIIPCNEESL
ncbi:Alpha/Beta hydrolase protein [Aspergillus pseudotamarii]|uniref:Alpha/Beta hydrolase protein n=1 Tax=Aspergillus pseudotamarii TaxID=132259 RepID=A0A5N6T1M1_ASPPS|nr:Alpha/Beta hydrolase protein [Aspergillus pseudotamarii]KAE8140004.1 Alpha/Beta hydrolase protein [Aspergillus pseudotamarii]